MERFVCRPLLRRRASASGDSTDAPGLKHRIVSRWDAPLDSGLRERSLFDVGDLFRQRTGCDVGTVVLVRPDDHVAAILPMNGAMVEELYKPNRAPQATYVVFLSEQQNEFPK